MTRKILVALALVAALGLTFGAFGDDIWTVSPYSACADDGNPSLNASSSALQSVRCHAPSLVASTLVAGALPAKPVPWSGKLAQRSQVRSPGPPPQRC